MLSRRTFLQHTAALAGACLVPTLNYGKDEGQIVTVLGPMRPSQLKFTLSHEHILVDFVGADKVDKNRYSAAEVFDIALPYLKDVKTRGCDTFIDCTPAYIGRDVLLLQRLSKASGLNIITTTGYYGAAKEKYIPAHAYIESAEKLASRWIKEWTDGIEETEIRPGLIKTGVDNGPLSEVQRKLIDAAAITHLATGLTIGVHTGDGAAAKEQLDILNNRGVAPAARIWIHAQNEKNKTYHQEAAQRGSWVSFDGVNPGSINENVDFLQAMKAEGLLDHVLVSQDSGWYHVGEPKGGKFNHFNTIFTTFIPALKQSGFTQKELDTLFITNPAKAFTIKIRKTT
jgi:predicted metal-dependent phosphotriesterase family hydrolase